MRGRHAFNVSRWSRHDKRHALCEALSRFDSITRFWAQTELAAVIEGEEVVREVGEVGLEEGVGGGEVSAEGQFPVHVEDRELNRTGVVGLGYEFDTIFDGAVSIGLDDGGWRGRRWGVSGRTKLLKLSYNV